MSNTLWKAIEGFPHYEVSNTGLVRTWRRKSCTWREQRDDWRDEPKEMKPFTDALGYRSVVIRGPTKKIKRFTVHRLVALAFIENPLGLSDVAHNDGNPSNNVTANLRWSTHQDNQMDMRRHQTMQDGERCITAKLTEAQALDIQRRAQVRGEGIKLSREYGLSRAQISRIKNGKRWAYLT